MYVFSVYILIKEFLLLKYVQLFIFQMYTNIFYLANMSQNRLFSKIDSIQPIHILPFLKISLGLDIFHTLGSSSMKNVWQLCVYHLGTGHHVHVPPLFLGYSSSRGHRSPLKPAQPRFLPHPKYGTKTKIKQVPDTEVWGKALKVYL